MIKVTCELPLQAEETAVSPSSGKELGKLFIQSHALGRGYDRMVVVELGLSQAGTAVARYQVDGWDLIAAVQNVLKRQG